jgi:hypothetical protein
MTTNWVLAGRTEGFPLMYHWRVLTEPNATAPPSDEPGSLDRLVEYRHGSAVVRRRLEALQHATASVVLLLQYVPQNLDQWLRDQLHRGDEALESACAMVGATHLVNWLVSPPVKPADTAERNAYVRRVAAGSPASDVPPWGGRDHRALRAGRCRAERLLLEPVRRES